MGRLGLQWRSGWGGVASLRGGLVNSIQRSGIAAAAAAFCLPFFFFFFSSEM